MSNKEIVVYGDMKYTREVIQDDDKWKITIERPILTKDEYERRLNRVKQAAVELLREYIAKGFLEDEDDTNGEKAEESI